MNTIIPIKPDPQSTDADPTAALVQRVSDRLAKGVPLRLAAATEGLSSEQYEEHLRQRPELALLQDSASCEFVEFCIRKLLNAQDPSSNIRWLLDRLYPEMFSPQRQQKQEPKQLEATPQAKQTILGVPEEALEAARAELQRRIRENDWD